MKINMKPPNSSEYLSTEILEEDFLKVFSLYCTIQKIMGVCRVDARDRFVTAPSIPQKIYTIIYITCIFISCIGFQVYADGLNTRLYYLAVSGLILIVITFLSNAIHVRFLNNDSNVAFYIKMQEIDRLMDINQCKSINSILFKMHIFTLIALAGMAILIILLITLFSRRVLVFGVIILGLSYGSFIFEMAYCSNLTAYFSLRVRFINTMMESHIHAQPTKVYTTRSSYMKCFASLSHNFETSDTDVYLERIMECFFKYQDLYNFQVNLNYNVCTYKIT